VAAHAFVRGILSTGGTPVLITGETITPNYFDVLGVRPALGRGFRDDENVGEGQHAVVVLSHGLWQRRFGGRADILGQAVELSGVKYTVVGVAPPAFTGMVPGLESQFWAPVMMVDRFNFQGIQSEADHDPGATRIQKRGQRWLFVKGRLAEGKTVEQARAQVDTIFARLRQDCVLAKESLSVDTETLIGRFYLLHMICIRPEVTDFVIGSSCDYSFVPEMCPSANIVTLGFTVNEGVRF